MARGQTGLEYLLMIAGGVLLSAVVMAVANNNLNVVGDSINSSDYSSRIQNYLSTGNGANDGDWVIVGDDQFSGVPGNVGIGTTNPNAKLEVNGDSKFGGNMNLSNNLITGLAAPVNDTDAATKGYVDAASGSIGSNTSVIFNSTLNMGMPLQGMQILYATYDGYISTVPIALPTTGCSIKVTACGANAPVKMIVGADPVIRQTKARLNELMNGAVGVYSGIATLQSGGAGPACGFHHVCEPYYGCWATAANNCPSATDTCIGETYCCASNTPESSGGQCSNCTTQGYLSDWEDSMCYKEPRCPAADTNYKFIIEDDTDNVCVYCPNDHPTYDPNLKTCIKNTTISTNKISTRCSTLSTTLATTITDVTFADNSGAAIDAANYVAIAYSCPVD